MFYLVLGTNGLAIHADKEYAEKCKPYLKCPTIHAYPTFKDAHYDAMECLKEILPDDYPLPNRIPQRKLITKNRYFEHFPQLEEKSKDPTKKEPPLVEVSSLEDLSDQMMNIEINA